MKLGLELYLEGLEMLYIIVGLVFVALWGLIVIRRNAIIVFMSLEILLLALNLLFVYAVVLLDDSLGLMYMLLVLTIAAAESAIGLAILVVYYRLRGVIELESISYLKG